MSETSNWRWVNRLKMWRSKRICGRRSGRKPQPLVSTVKTAQTSGGLTDNAVVAAATPPAVRASDFPTNSMGIFDSRSAADRIHGPRRRHKLGGVDLVAFPLPGDVAADQS